MKSCWLFDETKNKYPSLEGLIDTDILIIGGGISGISLAYELKDINKKIILVEQNELYHGASGYTTGKITFQHSFIYQELIKKFGPSKAKMYFDANREALSHILEIINQHQLKCDLVISDNYLFDSQNKLKYEKEKLAYDSLDISYKEELIFKNKALKVENQAVFNIVKYLDGLLKILDKCDNVKIFEHSKVLKTKFLNKGNFALGEKFNIKAKIIIFACGYPCYKNFNFFFLKLKPVISFVTECKTCQKITSSVMDYASNVFSFRPYNEDSALFSGESIDSAKLKSYREINNLKTRINEYFPEALEKRSWLNQDYQVLDKVPLIGRLKKDVYLMTGYNKWGITNSVFASRMIKELIINNYSPYEKLFSPKRSINIFEYLSYICENIYSFVKSKIKYHGKKCTHLHCNLRQNPIDKTFDCPCHGTRYRMDGIVITGPAKKNIDKK